MTEHCPNCAALEEELARLERRLHAIGNQTPPPVLPIEDRDDDLAGEQK